MILVFSILSWVICVIFGIVAWVMGNSDLREMDAGRMDPEGRGMTQAGKIIGMIHVIVSIAAIGLMLVLFLFFGGLAAFMGTQQGGTGGP
jgi:hypothetical protein